MYISLWLKAKDRSTSGISVYDITNSYLLQTFKKKKKKKK